MPLYVDDFDPNPMPLAYQQALIQCASAIGAQAANPALAMQVLRGFLLPLLPLQHRPLLEVGGQASWDRLWILYAHLAAASRGDDEDLIAAAQLVKLLVRHTTRPPREIEFPPHLELSSFARMAASLELPVVPPIAEVAGSDLRLYNFCKFCWLPQRARGVCSFHSTRASSQQPGAAPKCTLAPHKLVQRLRPDFERLLNALLSAEEWHFHDSGFAAPVMLPPSGIGAWLRERRPFLAAEASRMLGQMDAVLPLHLLRVLYGDAAQEVAQVVGGAVYLLTPITARAEAWLQAWDARANWGGRREGAGRRAAGTPRT